jgi:microcystin-dependent protein
MADPTTVNKGFFVPNTGADVGTWGTVLNTNFAAMDGNFGGFAILALSVGTTFALSNSGASLTPGAGPNQSTNALLKFTGTLSGNNVVQFSVPGFYIIDNRCTVGSFYIQLAPSAGTGTFVGAPPGQKVWVFYDGTNVDYVDQPPVGSAMDLHGVTAIPAWMSACSVLPYLIKDGTTYNVATYPALAAYLGSTFGGNGVTTFAVPDERSRMRMPLDTNGPGSFAGRVTALGSGVTGTTMGSSGGNELTQQHTHTVTDPGHTHALTGGASGIVASGGGGANNVAPSGGFTTGALIANATTGITIANFGSGSSQNMVPTIVSFLPLVKT